MKTKRVFKSLAELPGQALSFAASVPERTVQNTQKVLAPPVRVTRREIRAARRRSLRFMREFYERASTPFRHVQPWPRGGLNE